MAFENKKLVARMRGDVLTPKEVGEILRLSYPTVMRRIKEGSIPSTKFGDRYRISRSVLDKTLTTS